MAWLRRGTVTDIPVILIVLLSLAITVLVSSLILDTVIGATTNSMINQEVLKEARFALSMYDFGVAFVATGMFSVSILFAWRIQTSAINIAPAVLFLSMSVWLSSEFSNIFALFTGANQQLTNVAANYTGIQLLFNNLPVLVSVFGGVMLVALYVRRGQPQGEVTA